MKKYYFTCGQSHSHLLAGRYTWDKDSMICVEAKTKDAAIDFIMGKFGTQWAMCYDTPVSKEYAPNGIIKTFTL